jgi:hypothetical protein
MTPALILAVALMASAAPPPDSAGEPLPPGAPTDEYQLTAWCYGAMKEYLDIYEEVKPELVDIDRMFGDPVKESEPYQSDMAAARVELKMMGNAVTLAEKASPRPIAVEGAAALRQGEMIWSVAESRTRRELARAWLMWALPDKCDSVSRKLAAKSALFGRALKYNTGPDSPPPDVAAMAELPHAPLPGEALAAAPMTHASVAPAFVAPAPPTPNAQAAPQLPPRRQAVAPPPPSSTHSTSSEPAYAEPGLPALTAQAAPAEEPAGPPAMPPPDAVIATQRTAAAPAQAAPPPESPPPPEAAPPAPSAAPAPPPPAAPPGDQSTEPLL